MLNLNNNQNDIITLKESLFNQNIFGIIRIDNQGYPITFNKRFLTLLSFESEEEFFQFYSTNLTFKKNTNPLKYQKILELEVKPHYLESKWINKNGQIVFFKEYVTPVYNQNNEIIYYDCILEDVTDVKLIETILKKYQSRDLSILKALPDLLLIISSDGIFRDYKYSNHDNFILFTNPAEIIGKTIYEIFPKDISEKINNAIKQTIDDKQLQTVEFELSNLENNFYFEARIIYNSPDEALVLLRDITTQKQAEANLRKVKEDLEIANKEKDKFFSLIAHDLRTPLVGLAGYAEILASDINELTKEEIKEYSNSIVEITRQAIKFLQNLLEWSRLQTGKLQYMPAELSINLIVDSISKLLQSNLERKKIKFVNLTNPEHIVFADENMIYSVLNNLISNAIKFSNEGGEIVVRTYKQGDSIVTSVKDNGVGMTEEQLQNLFVLNKTFSTLGTSKEKGTGLGIILCRDFVSRNFGKLWVESIPNKGSEFYFSLPKYKPN